MLHALLCNESSFSITVLAKLKVTIELNNFNFINRQSYYIFPDFNEVWLVDGHKNIFICVLFFFQNAHLKLQLGLFVYKETLSCNYGHNIVRLFDTLPHFLLTTSETKCDY